VGQRDSAHGSISAPSAKIEKPSIERAVAVQAPHFSQKPAQIPATLLQDGRIVLGKAEHAVAVAAKQAADFKPSMAMIDEEELFGLLFAYFASATLTRHHSIVVLQGNPIGILEIILATPTLITSTCLFRVGRILLLPKKPLRRDFLFVGFLIGGVGGEFLRSKDWILCISFLLPFTPARHRDFSFFNPALRA
jgi:hypothetical protein